MSAFLSDVSEPCWVKWLGISVAGSQSLCPPSHSCQPRHCWRLLDGVANPLNTAPWRKLWSSPPITSACSNTLRSGSLISCRCWTWSWFSCSCQCVTWASITLSSSIWNLTDFCVLRLIPDLGLFLMSSWYLWLLFRCLRSEHNCLHHLIVVLFQLDFDWIE